MKTVRTSKYLGRVFDLGWTCIDIGIDYIQSTKSKYAGHRTYYYVFQRRTSDNKADKMIRLNSTEAANVYHGHRTVESYATRRKLHPTPKTKKRVSYCFQ